MVAIAGGTASLLGGGKFSNGAMSAAFVFMFNEMAGYRLKQTRGRYNISDRAGNRGLIQSGKSRALLVITKQDIADGCSDASLVSGLAASSIPPSHARIILTASSAGFGGLGMMLNNTPNDVDAIYIVRDTMLSAIMPAGYTGIIIEESVKLYMEYKGN